MPESNVRSIGWCLFVVTLVIGFTTAPVTAIEVGVSADNGVTVDTGEQEVKVDDDEVSVGDQGVDTGTGDDVEPDEVTNATERVPADSSDVPAPEEACTDVVDESLDAVPWNDLPWTNDLPEEAQPPNLPADLVHPRLVASLVSGVTPNQCEVQDPNNPSYDPVRDGVNPGVHTGAYDDLRTERTAIAIVSETTLDRTGEGPGVTFQYWTLRESGDHEIATQVALNDGEKDYAVTPAGQFHEDGTGTATSEIRVLNGRLAVGTVCNGEECQPVTEGVPQAGAPAVPAPTGQDNGSGDSDGDFPEEFCTDVPDEVNSEAPWGDVPWFDDLPDEVPADQLPTNLLNPQTIPNLVAGAAPNQCEIQDPNDPSYDPRDDDVDPDADIQEAHDLREERTAIAAVSEATLNQSGSGPGVTIQYWTLRESGDHEIATQVALNDGEKDYALTPHAYVAADGEATGGVQVRLIQRSAGFGAACDGEECQVYTQGTPAAPVPPIPVPTSQVSGGSTV